MQIRLLNTGCPPKGKHCHSRVTKQKAGGGIQVNVIFVRTMINDIKAQDNEPR